MAGPGVVLLEDRLLTEPVDGAVLVRGEGQLTHPGIVDGHVALDLVAESINQPLEL